MKNDVGIGIIGSRRCIGKSSNALGVSVHCGCRAALDGAFQEYC